MLIGAELRACFFLEVSVFQRKNVAKIFALQGANVAKMDMLIRICPSLHGRARRSNKERSISTWQGRRRAQESHAPCPTWTRSMWRARSWGPRMLWGGSLYLAFMPLLLPWRRINVFDRLAHRTFVLVSTDYSFFLRMHAAAQGLVVQGIETQAKPLA